MVFFENFRIAFGALRANLMRSILTTLGIIIGVAAVIAVVSIVQGLQYTITQQLQGVGATFMLIQPKTERNFPGMVARQVKLTYDDGQAVEQKVPGVKILTPSIFGRAANAPRAAITSAPPEQAIQKPTPAPLPSVDRSANTTARM